MLQLQQLQHVVNEQMQQQAAAQQQATAQQPAPQATAPMQPLTFLGMKSGQPIFQHMDTAPTDPDIFPIESGGLVRKTPHGILQLPYVLVPIQGEQ